MYNARSENDSHLTPEIETRYAEERSRLTRRRVRTACLLAISTLPFFALSDYWLYRDALIQLLVARTLAVGVAVGALALLRLPTAEGSGELIGMSLGLGLTLTISAFPVYMFGYATPYYLAFMLVIFGMALLMPWPSSHAGAFALIQLALYVLASLLHGSIANWPEFLCNAATMATAIGIALVSMNAGEELRVREFRSRVALHDAYEKKSQMATELADKTAKLETLNREMEDLLYAASHDLRAPLINVQGFSRELQLALEQLRSHNGKSPESTALLTDTDESLQFILSAVARMDGLISSLLNISRIATRTNPTEAVDLNLLLEKLAESFHYQLVEKRITLECSPLPVVTGDSVRLGQLFGNLIDNAIKYMANGGERRIHVGIDVNAREPRLFVRDTGPGIPKSEQEHVFRLFRRLARGDSPGEGIGLTMARKIVEKHGGRMWVESEPGQGSTFWFTLRRPTELAENGGM